MQPDELAHPRRQERRVGMAGQEPPRIVGGEVERRRAAHDPLGQRAAGAAGAGDAAGVEPGGDEVAAQPRRLAENEITVRREALQPVQEELFSSATPNETV